jgi:hypothetical protein
VAVIGPTDPILKIKTAPVFEPLLKRSGKSHFFAGLVVEEPRARNASFDHARRYAVITGQLFRGPVQLWLRS